MSKETEVQTVDEKTELATVATGALATFIQEDASDDIGFEDMGDSTKAVPYIKVLNKLSPELDKESTSYASNAMIGDIFNTITKQSYGQNVPIICVKFEHIVTEWKPERGGFVGYHTPLEAEGINVDTTFGKWRTESGNSLVDTYMYYFVIVGHETDGVVVFAADSSDIREGKKLNAALDSRYDANGRKAKRYVQVYKMMTILDSNAKGKWYRPTFSFLGFINEEKLYKMIVGVREHITEIEVDYTKLDGKSDTVADVVADDSEY